MLFGEKNRDKFIQFMQGKGVSVGINYIPNHIQPFFRAFRRKLPVTERVWKEIVTLPLFSAMTEREIRKVKFCTKAFLEGSLL